jgi:Beta-lactamase
VNRTRRTRVRIFSVSQTFTAAIVLELAEEGKLHLNDRLAQYVHGVVGLGHRITLLQLLNPTSGLANYTDFGIWLERANRSKPVRPLNLLKLATFSPARSSDLEARTRTRARLHRVGSCHREGDRSQLWRGADAADRAPAWAKRNGVGATRQIPGLRDLGINSPLYPGLRVPGINPNLLWAAAGIISTAS